ncbi:helicase-related protein [Phycisphaeraceae bacterium D3-23]
MTIFQAYPPGTLVRARDREWVVLPDSDETSLVLRPIGGLDDEVTRLCPSIEPVFEATFDLPDPARSGNFNSCRLLRDAARLSTRSAAGPFRSFGRVAVEPRPYQLVPLLMAMRLDPVRLLIADDVGIGKTIEASLIARELLDRGEIERIAVLCPPHLAEQWQRELAQKFHIEAELVLSSTVGRLERRCRPGESLFDRFSNVIISTDFIKSAQRRDDFVRACPELVIVDEAHTCTLADKAGKGRQARYELVKRLTESEDRHVILVTATPHSGNESAFRSLLSLLDEKFAYLPENLESKERESVRKGLAQHLVQRRRRDIEEYVGSKTEFPVRQDKEESYLLDKEYKAFVEKAFQFARSILAEEPGEERHRRVRWWSAVALLRAIASSPRAAAATLKNRAATADAETAEEIDDLGRRVVLDQEDSDSVESLDFTPGSDASKDADRSVKDKIRVLAKEAEGLEGKKDAKLQGAIKHIKDLLNKGHNPIVFCRFIETANYVAEQLRDALKKQKAEVVAITGQLPPKDREARIEQLSEYETRVLVCTDCLSEGVNLQASFDAVFHYDLSWNPTRHEQREGRVDRFGQANSEVRVVTYFGRDNQIDGVVLDVLLRKHKQIKSDLGISIAVPGNSEDVAEALFEGLLLREAASGSPAQAFLPQFEEWLKPQREEIHAKWEEAREKEKKSRSRFAQHTISTEEVSKELGAVRSAIGAGPLVKEFLTDVLHLAQVPFSEKNDGRIEIRLTKESSRALRNAIGHEGTLRGRFDLPIEDKEKYLCRTSPEIEGLASYVIETALDEIAAEDEQPIASRCGIITTDAVNEKTTLLLVRYRYHLHVKKRGGEAKTLLAEEIIAPAFTGTPEKAAWLDEEVAKTLLDAKPSANTNPSLAKAQLERLVSIASSLDPELNKIATQRAAALGDAHNRIREQAKMTGKAVVEPMLPADLLGCFILLPHQGGA